MTLPVAIVGSGFAGTILARALAARGVRVLLLERARHPRFALGESSTPLASISLERLSAEYDLPDLLRLASYRRWNRELPGVGHGLKRGFTFYAHRRGAAYANGPRNESRLAFAASPDDDVADSHWVRADVDHYLARRAVREGVELLEGCRVDGAVPISGGWRLSTTYAGAPLAIEASFVVDAGGGRAMTPEGGEHVDSRRTPVRTGLVFGHFEAVGRFAEGADGASFSDAPYPEERAAVHHLLEEGWMYVLPFDHGVVSAGFVLDHDHPDTSSLLGASPGTAWAELLSRYPTLRRQFGSAVAARPTSTVARLQRRSPAAAGEGWARLPSAFRFSSPMFSTGIAWSLVGVERLARILTRPGGPDPWALDLYARLLATEADHIDGLIGPAYRFRSDFAAFSAWTRVYLTAASFWETMQRLRRPAPGTHWSDFGFLGAGDPELRAAARETRKALTDTDDPEAAASRLLARRDVIGLDRPRPPRLYPVDVDVIIENAHLIGLTSEEARNRLPRLRGPG
ncbi:MAG: FAD-binding oxidoreductase [Gemmatimonadetes bacterium]|nr:FAD-binding oxidoreductase [Gemmatimonadota bacterium]